MPRNKSNPAPRGMGRIIPNATGSFTFRYWANGKQVEETFTTRKLAEDRQAKVYLDKRAGELTFADKSKAAVRFTDYAGEWVDRHSNEGTRTVLRSTLKRLAADLGTRTLAQVANDREGAQALIDAAPGSYKRRTRIVLVSPCNEALKAGRIGSHRLRGLRVEETSRKAVFTYATPEALDALATALGTYGLAVWTGRLLGLRLGESLGLRRDDFREGGTVLRLSRTRLANGTLGPLKARKVDEFRDVPVPAVVWEMIKDAPVDDDGYLFPAIWQSYVHKMVRDARDSCGIPPGFTMHHCRHMYASDMLAAGIPITDLARYLGHQDVKITYATYGHLAPSAFGRAREVFASWGRPALRIAA